MKKGLILTLAAIMLLSTAALATNTRVLTMGEANNVLLDEANIWLYPSRISMYPNVAIGEAGYYNFGSGYELGSLGIHWKFNEKNPWVLGTYLTSDIYKVADGLGGLGLSNTTLPFRYPSYDFFSVEQDDWWFPDPQTLTNNWGNQRLSLFYGRKLGTMPFGFYFNNVSSSWKNESTTPASQAQRSLSEYDFGFGLTDPGGKWDLAAGLNLMSWKNKNNVGADITKPSGNKSFYAMGRYFKQMNPQWTVVPNAGVIIGSYKVEWYDQGTPNAVTNTESYKNTTFWLGLGAHYTPTASILAVLEGGVGYTSNKVEWTSLAPATVTHKLNSFTLPYIKTGIEGKVFDWMDLRAGAVSYWNRTSDENVATGGNNTKIKYNYPNNRTYLGAGLHFGNLHIDTYTDPQFLLKGPNFVSGGTTEDLNFAVSVLYDFK